jgi:hypothetical protein
MNYKLIAIFLTLLLGITAFSAQPSRKPNTARFMVQGTYEETYQGTTAQGRAEGKLIIKYEAARWVTLSTNEVGNAEFSDLKDAPAPSVSGSVSYEGRVKSTSGGNSYDAMSSFAGPLSSNDVVLSVPEYTDTSNGFKIRVSINPKLKGKCSLVEVRDGETGTVNGCNNGTYFFTSSSPMQIDDNDDPGKTPDSASFGLELDIEPEMAQAPAGDAGDYAWRGAVTNGSKEAGFKIALDKTKELPSADNRGRSTRKLVFNATIIPGSPGKQ